MEMEYWANRRHVQMQIPSFGNWEIYNDMIPTHQVVSQNLSQSFSMEDFLNFDDHLKQPYHYPKPKKIVLDLKERKKQRRVCDETLQKQKGEEEEEEKRIMEKRKKRTPKAVDEDLYKIPPEFLYQQSKRKNRMGGLWKGCLCLGLNNRPS